MFGRLRTMWRKPEVAAPTLTTQNDLWWVKAILNVGRPVVAVIVLVMCAPGEHYLARLAGWSHWLAWGMPATLTAYAGIAAVVATKRPKGSPGKKTAVAGAIISVALAMGAQPIAHLYERHLVTGHQFLLTIVVSCIPALVFGHLLHMAAAPVVVAPVIIPGARTVPPGVVIFDGEEDEEDQVEYSPDAFSYSARDENGLDADLESLGVPLSPEVIAERRRLLGVPSDVPDPFDREPVPWNGDNVIADSPTEQALRGYLDRMTVRDPAPDMWTKPPVDPESVPESVPGDMATASANGRPTPLSVPSGVRPVVPSRTAPDNPGRRRTTGVTARVRKMIEDNPAITDEDIRDACPGDLPNSVGKSIKRVREERGETT